VPRMGANRRVRAYRKSRQRKNEREAPSSAAHQASIRSIFRSKRPTSRASCDPLIDGHGPTMRGSGGEILRWPGKRNRGPECCTKPLSGNQEAAFSILPPMNVKKYTPSETTVIATLIGKTARWCTRWREFRESDTRFRAGGSFGAFGIGVRGYSRK